MISMKKMNLILFACIMQIGLLGLTALSGCSDSGITIEYGTLSKDSKTIELAVNDLKSCLSDLHAVQAGSYTLALDNTLKNGEFGYRIDDSGNVTFRGGDEIGITHAVYTYLEKLGYTFDITGISSPSSVNKLAGEPMDTLVKPSIRWRGIRQHVNFPMDISSYSIDEAKEYVDQLVRMRFNKLTIHSYPGQWYETSIGDSTALAGNYFYGNKHLMYDNALLQEKVPSNDSLFCIAEAEKLRYNPKANSQFALSWMQQFINHAKDRGMYVQFSFEPRITRVEQAVSTANDIIRTYPNIDALEMITEETGGWGKGCTREETVATLNNYFDSDIASDSTVRAPIRDRQSDLNDLYSQIGILSKAIKKMNSGKSDYPELKLGIYCSITPYTAGAYRLARLALPETSICLMSSHGSEGTSKALPDILRTKKDREMTEIYSWIEFDGLMYLYQNSIGGNERIMGWLSDSDIPVKSVLYNHWRTAENRTSARFAAESTIDMNLSSSAFYTNYAGRLSLPDRTKYTEAMELVNQADTFSTRKLGNIGFCWMGAWRNGGSYTWMGKDNINYARGLYFKAGKILTELLKHSKEGSEAYSYLSFVCNRVLCSVLYLDAFSEAVNIQQITRSGKNTQTEESKAFVRNVCDKALLIFDQYMEKHAEMLIDRGCEGTLVSVWNAPIRGLKIYREKLGGVPMDGPSSLDAVDAPPLPIVY